MNKTITLEFPAKKLEALSHFLKKKDTTIEAELDYALARLYEKTVPPTVREFLEDTGSDGIHLRISKITYKDVQRYGREKSGADLRRRSR